MDIDPAPSADEAAAIIVALAQLRRANEPSPERHSAWRIAGRMPWLSDDDVRAAANHNRMP